LPFSRESEAATANRPERFQAKWLPVRVKKTRQHKNPKPGSDSIRAWLWSEFAATRVAIARPIRGRLIVEGLTILFCAGLAPPWSIARRATGSRSAPAGSIYARGFGVRIITKDWVGQ